jgi:prepilin-type N-terminal cleavage/methylation domain-containing protein
MSAKREKRGFNLVETMVASVILSGAVLTVAAVSTRALTGTKLNRQYEIAASLIDKQFSLIDYLGIDEFVETGQTEGVFEEFEPGYYWQISTEYQYIDSLYLVTMKVTWMEHNRPYTLTVDTMFDGISVYADTGSE